MFPKDSLVVLSLALLGIAPCIADPAIIQTSLGDVRGQCDGDTCSWLNIPFANPFDRFAFSLVRSEAYKSGGVGSTGIGPACMQFAGANTSAARLPQSEDCLQLNIWTPRNSTLAGRKVPVMVFIHGGGFFTGATREKLYNGTSLSSNGVAVVTINYRLGALGSFLLPDGTGGDLGLGDQITALQWVKGFIHNFGGDPDSVTIFGQSAGSDSVCCLVHSPLAAGLFHRAMMESGECLHHVVPREVARSVYGNFLKNSNVTQEELQTMPATEVVNYTMANPQDPWKNHGIGRPFVDGAVLPGVPLSLDPLPVDVVLGMTSFDNPAVTNIPGGRLPYFTYWLGDSAARILSHYNSSDRDVDIAHDACTTCETAHLARRIAQKRKASRVFVYLYDYPHNAAKHCAELKAIWGKNTSKFDPPPELTSWVQHLWTSFAATGIPDNKGSWPQVHAWQSVKAQVISMEPKIVEFESPACQDWISSLESMPILNVSAMCRFASPHMRMMAPKPFSLV